MKIIILGSNGMLGSKLFQYFTNLSNFDVHGVSKSIPSNGIQENFTQIDFLSNEYKEKLRLLKDNFQPDVVINSSGMTSLALCEKDNAIANFLNGEINSELIDVFKNSKFIYISTDSVFDGKKGNFIEEDETQPLNSYANSKVLGEKATLSSGNNSLVLRTNIYGKKEFSTDLSLVDWALSMFSNNKDIQGFNDFIFNPLHLLQVSKAIECIIKTNESKTIFHLGCKEHISKYKFLQMLKDFVPESTSKVNPTKSITPDDGIIRPKITTLNSSKFSDTFNIDFSLKNGINEIFCHN